jgi:hypothetical protein
MFMHYFGGGIGHLRQDFFQEVTHKMDVDSEPKEYSMHWSNIRDSLDTQLKTPKLPAESSDKTEREEAQVDDHLLDSASDSDFGSNVTWSDHYSDDD